MTTFRHITRQSYFRCLIFLGALISVFSVLSPFFLSFKNFDNVLSASAVTGLLALGVTFVIAAGGIDLSIASVMALAGTVCAFFVQDSSFGALHSLVLCIIIGGVVGAFTGGFVNLTRAPSFIVTLGMLSVARALSYIVADGTPIYGLPVAVTEFGQGKVAGVSISVIILILAAVVAHLILHSSVFGAHTLLYGDNGSAAEAMGIRVDRLRLKIYSLCGAFAGLAGFVFMARTNAGDPTAGQNYELIAITAVILGGTNLFGGQGTIIGTLLGTLCLGTLQNGLTLLAVGTYYQVLFVGIVLLGSALLERFGRQK